MAKPFTLIILLIFSGSLYAQDLEPLWDLYNTKKYSETIKEGLTVLKDIPDNPELNLIIGRAYSDSHKHEIAIPYLLKGTEGEGWINGWSHAYLGKCYMFTDQYEKAKRSYLKCIELNATDNSTSFAKRSLIGFQMTPFFESLGDKRNGTYQVSLSGHKRIRKS